MARAVRAGFEILLALLVVNLPAFAYAWLYPRVWNLLAGGLYFALLIALAVAASHLARRSPKEPEQMFGCFVVLATVPGIFLGIFVIAPYLELRLHPPALQVGLSEVDQLPPAAFYSFREASIRGDLARWRKEQRRHRTGESTVRWVKHFQVAPVVGPAWARQRCPQVWLASEDDEKPAFGTAPEGPLELSGQVLVKPDAGFGRAIAEACARLGLDPPKQPLLLERSDHYAAVLVQSSQRLRWWLGIYNGAFILITVAMLVLRRKAEASAPSPGEPAP